MHLTHTRVLSKRVVVEIDTQTVLWWESTVLQLFRSASGPGVFWVPCDILCSAQEAA